MPYKANITWTPDDRLIAPYHPDLSRALAKCARWDKTAWIVRDKIATRQALLHVLGEDGLTAVERTTAVVLPGDLVGKRRSLFTLGREIVSRNKGKITLGQGVSVIVGSWAESPNRVTLSAKIGTSYVPIGACDSVVLRVDDVPVSLLPSQGAYGVRDPGLRALLQLRLRSMERDVARLRSLFERD